MNNEAGNMKMEPEEHKSLERERNTDTEEYMIKEEKQRESFKNLKTLCCCDEEEKED